MTCHSSKFGKTAKKTFSNSLLNLVAIFPHLPSVGAARALLRGPTSCARADIRCWAAGAVLDRFCCQVASAVLLVTCFVVADKCCSRWPAGTAVRRQNVKCRELIGGQGAKGRSRGYARWKGRSRVCTGQQPHLVGLLFFLFGKLNIPNCWR
jgi:hypothetical protein